MMDTPGPTPLPIPTFDQNDTERSSAQLHDFLKEFLARVEAKDPQVKQDGESWQPILTSISEGLLDKFYTPDAMRWNAMHENLKLTEHAVELLQCGAERVDGLYALDGEFALDSLTRLLNLCVILDFWMEQPVPVEEKYLSPEEMQKRTMSAAIAILRSLVKPSHSKGGEHIKPLYERLRRTLVACITTCKDIHLMYLIATYPLKVTIFDAPRFHDINEALECRKFINISNPHNMLRLLSFVCELCIRWMSPPTIDQWYLYDLVRDVTTIIERTVDLLLSPSCNVPMSGRAAILARLTKAILGYTPPITMPEGFQKATLLRIIQSRLSIGPSESWTRFDVTVKKALETVLPLPPTWAQDVHPVLALLQSEQWGENDGGLRALAGSYLTYTLPHQSRDTLRSISDVLSTEDRVAYYTSIVQAVHTRLNALSSTAEKVDVDTSPKQEWRTLVKTVVEVIVEPDTPAWMDDDNSFSDMQYINRALQEVEKRYRRPLYNPSPSARESLARALGRFPCTLIHGAATCQSICSASRPTIDTLNAFTAVSIPLLDGPKEEVTPRVRKAVYDALMRTLVHHTSGFGGKLDKAGEVAMRGMKDRDRSVRLSAGQCLVELIKLYQNVGTGAYRRTAALFDVLVRLFDTADDKTRETALITLGRVGRIAQPEALGQTIYCLIAQLGHKSPLLRGTAHMQLQTLTNLHKKTPFALVLPYMAQLAPYLLSRLPVHPMLLVETCRFLSIKPDAFISVTLHHTLPQLFADCNVKALEAVSRELKERVSQLFLRYSHHILAHAFRLSGPGQSNKVLNFIVGLLKDESQRNLELDLTSLVGSCKIPLLAELTAVLGEEDLDLAESAKQALRKVERAMRQTPSATRSSPGQTLGAFLKPHMLAIITNLNDQLQDVYGKRTLETKRTIVRSLGVFIREMGPAISTAAPQIMATLQTMLLIPQLTDVTLRTWREFLASLDVQDLGPYVGPTSASFLTYWPNFSLKGREDAKACLDYIISDKGAELDHYLDEVVDLASIPQLAAANRTILAFREAWTPRDKLENILDRSASENLTVCMQSLQELKLFMTSHPKFMRSLASGDVFVPLVGRIVDTLFAASCRDGEGTEPLRMLAFECIGVLGAVDPDRFEISSSDTRMIVWQNFNEENESVTFVLHLISDVLVGAFRSTSDIKYQSHLAYAIQELLRFCKFSPGLIAPGPSNSIPLRIRNRWNSLPKHVLETVSPLLTSRFSLDSGGPAKTKHPIYPAHDTYREWIQSWIGHLLTRTSGERASTIFNVFPAVVRNRDVGVARHLLPHLVLHVLISGDGDDVTNIRSELLAVLEDQIEIESHSTSNKKLLSAQTVFMLLDHLSHWRSVVYQELATAKEGPKSKDKTARQAGDRERQLLMVDSVLSNINQDLMAKAALQCRAYARSLMHFERQILVLQERQVKDSDLPGCYERLHEIYAHLDEPDGMEGISTLILSPSLEHQIRQHESTGRWTSAQSCWEVRLQSSPDNLELHLGLMRCLRNLGHYDTLRTHVKGILTRNPDWEPHLVGFHVESELMVGNWNEVQQLLRHTESEASSVLLARVLLALRDGQDSAISWSLSTARTLLGAPIIAAGARSYRRSYNAVLDLHLVHELETIHRVVASSISKGSGLSDLGSLSSDLLSRLDSTLPTFRTRGPILSMRRIAFALTGANQQELRDAIGQSWLASARIARKAGHWQTAYSAMLQARQCEVPSCFIESAKLVRASGEPLRALHDLENHMRLANMFSHAHKADERDDVIDLTDDTMVPSLKSKAQLLRARWMYESDRYELNYILKAFQSAVSQDDKWESGHFYVGRFHDECFKELSAKEKAERGLMMSFHTVRAFTRAMRYGSKYIYQTVPRLLTLWLDLGETSSKDSRFQHINNEIVKAIKAVPVYKWFTAFPQIVSRVGHSNELVYTTLSQLIYRVIHEYPKQALWLFVSVVKSTKAQRADRGKAILDQLKTADRGDVPNLINESPNALLELCNRPVRDEKRLLNMQKDFPALARLAPSRLIIPLQDSLTPNVPPTSASESTHQPFPPAAPTFLHFLDEVEIMRSLARPRKIGLTGSDGKTYMFLGKPKDDLRKDARLMDFNMIINKLLKSNSESRRRQLHIRTYGVITLNEECGFIQWVPNTVPIRPIITSYYERRGVRNWNNEMHVVFQQIKTSCTDKEAAVLFADKVLPKFPPVFHEWFLERFPEPTAWLASRLAYSRTAAVMSMVGFILGLGDRHAENILLDATNGDVVHVDFNCLFEKGKQLETPERVPFRLTQNIIDGFGITGVEGIFRIACEVTMQLLRDNKDTLMTVLDAFIHDPLVEWEDEKRKKERESQRHRGGNVAKASIDLRKLALEALRPIEKKLKGVYTTSRERPEKETSTSNLVEILIQEASSNENLARMYPGWAPWH